jgi:leader peptidase (prepilin peptidase) / N-methyltransferase
VPDVDWLPALCGAAVGAAVGWGIRLLLAMLRRGTVLRPGVAETTCALVTGIGVGLAWGGTLLGLVVWAGWLGVALGAVDIRQHRLPDALTLPAIPITMLIVGLTEWLHPETGSGITALVVAAVLSGLFLLLALLAPSGMGRGDVKLVPSLAVMTGYLSIAAAVLSVAVAFVLGAGWAVVGLTSRRMTMKTAIPFGPFLLAGCWLVLVFPELVTTLVR